MTREQRGQETVPSATIPPRPDKAPEPPPVASGAMPDLPDAAITAAQEAITRVLAEDWHETWIESDSALARAALEAAAPALRAQGAATERAKWREALAEHVHWVTSYEGDRICAACLSIWPCAGATLLDGDDG